MFFLLLFCFIFCKNSKLAPFLQKEFTYYNIGISLKQNENTLSAMAARLGRGRENAVAVQNYFNKGNGFLLYRQKWLSLFR